MWPLDGIRRKVETDQFEFSKHAVDQSIRRRISVQEVRQTIANGETIEEYPEDKYWPSYLVFCKTTEVSTLHVQCSHPARELVKIVTLYEPVPTRWTNFRERRPQ